jgi:hypothetical protein
MLKILSSDRGVATPIGLAILASLILSWPIARVDRVDRTENKMTTANMAQLSLDNANPLSNFTDNLDSDRTAKILGITALGTGLLGLLWHRKQKQKPLSFDTVVANYNKQKNSQKNNLRIDAIDSKLRQKLLRLVHNDRSTANRLIAGASINHPNRSVNWLAEKVIYDLERDRRAY